MPENGVLVGKFLENEADPTVLIHNTNLDIGNVTLHIVSTPIQSSALEATRNNISAIIPSTPNLANNHSKLISISDVSQSLVIGPKSMQT